MKKSNTIPNNLNKRNQNINRLKHSSSNTNLNSNSNSNTTSNTNLNSNSTTNTGTNTGTNTDLTTNSNITNTTTNAKLNTSLNTDLFSISILNQVNIHKYIEQVQYKIKANDTACLIAKQASKSATKAVIKANKEIQTAIAIQNANKICNQVLNISTKILYEVHMLLTDLKLALYEKQINYLYQTMDTLLIKPRTPESDSSRITHVTLNDTNLNTKQSCCSKLIQKCTKSNSSKIYDISHKKKSKKKSKLKYVFSNFKNIFYTNEDDNDTENRDEDEDEDKDEFNDIFDNE